jgi:hypothetical protein
MSAVIQIIFWSLVPIVFYPAFMNLYASWPPNSISHLPNVSENSSSKYQLQRKFYSLPTRYNKIERFNERPLSKISE